MARPTQRPCRCFISICVSTVLLLLLSQALRHRYQEDRHRRDILDSTEIPAEHIDPAAIDLTPLVNTLINSSQSGSRQLFSLLSVTSYSSLALHKLTLLVYNISSIRSLENNMFRRRFCYCVTNETNDLTDFTAVLLDVIGNSTSYLHELFKSASILSVSQKNNSDCIYICVMGGKMGRNVPELWQVGSIMPLFNQTIVEGPHRGNISAFRLPVEWHQLPTNLSHMSPSGMSSILTSRVHSTAHVSPKTRDETAATTIKITMAQSPLTAQQPTTSPPQSWTTMDKLGTTRITMTQMVTAQKRTTQMATTQKTTKPTVAAAQLQTTTVLQLTITLPQPTTALLTTSASVTTTTAPPTTRPPQLTTESSVTTAFSPVIVTTRHHATSTGHPIRLSVDGLTAVPVVAQGMTGPPSMRKTTPSETMETERAGCPWRRPELNGKSTLGGYSISTTTVSAHKLQPCVLELCKFFSQCLCRPFNKKMRMKRYCDNSHIWYEKHTSEVCRRVRRVSFSRNLKQRCLTKMCSKL